MELIGLLLTTEYLYGFILYGIATNILSSLVMIFTLGFYLGGVEIEERIVISSFMKNLKMSILANNSSTHRTLTGFSFLIPFHDTILNIIFVFSVFRHRGLKGIIVASHNYYKMHIIRLKIPQLIK